METNFFEYGIPGEIEGQDEIFFFLTKTGYETLLKGLPTNLGSLSNEFLQIKSNITDNKAVITQLQLSLSDLNKDIFELMNKLTEVNSLKSKVEELEQKIIDLHKPEVPPVIIPIHLDIRNFIMSSDNINANKVAKKYKEKDLVDCAKILGLNVSTKDLELNTAQALIDFLR